MNTNAEAPQRPLNPSALHDRVTWILLFVAAIIAIFAWQYRVRFPFDNTFITFRYAEHLAKGLGLTWNVGGAPTEGYTNFLYIVFLAPFSLLGIDLVLVSQVANICALALTAVLIYQLTALLLREESQSIARWPSMLVSILFLLTPMNWINALSGMETSFFGLALIAATYTFAKAYYNHTTFTFAFVLAFAAALLRPEGALLGGILWLIILTDGRVRSEVTKSFVIYFVIPLIAYTLFRYVYFGSLVPNSFRVKVLSGETVSLFHLPGTRYVLLFWGSSLALVVMSIFGLRRFPFGRIQTAVLIFILSIAAFYLFAVPLMAFYDRFLYSVFVMLFVLAGVGMFKLCAGRSKLFSIAVITLLVVLHFQRSIYSPRAQEALGSTDESTKRYREIAELLHNIPNHEQISLCFADAGILPYYSGMKNLDAVGLNDNEIARAHSGQDVLRILADRRPDILLLPLDPPRPEDDSCSHIFRSGHGLVASVYEQIPHDTRFSDYRSIVMLHPHLYDIALMVNIRSPHAREIEAAFRIAEPSSAGLIGPPPNCLY
jgi:arabinofuranosyltransferase